MICTTVLSVECILQVEDIKLELIGQLAATSYKTQK